MTLPSRPLRTVTITVIAETEAPPPPPLGSRNGPRLSRLALPLALILAACAPPPPEPAETFPAAAPSGQPRLFVDADGLGASWVERDGEEAVLRFARRQRGQWSAPQTAARGADWFVNWADTPGVVPAGDGGYLAFYLQRTGEGTYDYAIRTVRSDDGGRTWAAPLTPHTESVAAEFGFVSAHAEADGVRLVWLDGEATAGGSGVHGQGPGAMALRSAIVRSDGTLAEEAVLDRRVCECCATAIVPAASGLVVAYRDRSPEEVRDVAVVRREGEGWTAPALPHADGWRIAGCPVNGPALAAEGDRVALAWYTGAGGSRVRLAVSEDGGRTFGAAREVAEESVIGRVDVAWARGEPLVTWMAREGEGAALYIRWGGAMPHRVAHLPAERASGLPRLAVVADTAWVAWVDEDGPRVRVAPVPLAVVPGPSTAPEPPSSGAPGR